MYIYIYIHIIVYNVVCIYIYIERERDIDIYICGICVYPLIGPGPKAKNRRACARESVRGRGRRCWQSRSLVVNTMEAITTFATVIKRNNVSRLVVKQRLTCRIPNPLRTRAAPSTPPRCRTYYYYYY